MLRKARRTQNRMATPTVNPVACTTKNTQNGRWTLTQTLCAIQRECFVLKGDTFHSNQSFLAVILMSQHFHFQLDKMHIFDSIHTHTLIANSGENWIEAQAYHSTWCCLMILHENSLLLSLMTGSKLATLAAKMFISRYALAQATELCNVCVCLYVFAAVEGWLICVLS